MKSWLFIDQLAVRVIMPYLSAACQALPGKEKITWHVKGNPLAGNVKLDLRKIAPRREMSGMQAGNYGIW